MVDKKLVLIFFFLSIFLSSYVILVLATDISDCSNLNSANSVYTLTADITNSNTARCMNVTAANVTLDCQGHTIDGRDTTNSVGINSTAANTTVVNCAFNDWYRGGVFYANYPNVTNSSFTSTGYHSLFLSGANYSTLLNNNFSAQTTYGVTYSNSNDGYAYGNSLLSGSIYGLEVSSANRNVFVNTTIDGGTGQNARAIYIASSNNNTFYNTSVTVLHTGTSRQAGLFWYNNNQTIDTSNTINGLPILAYGNAYVCPNNTVWTNGSSYAYMGFNGCNNITVRDSSPIDSIFMSVTTNSLIDNVSINNTYYGIYLESLSAGTNVTNSVFDNTLNGIYSHFCQSNTFVNNTVTGSNTGFQIFGTAGPTCAYEDNSIYGNGYGIYATSVGSSWRGSFSGGTFHDNSISDYFIGGNIYTLNFTNTNFTGQREIFLTATGMSFSYSNATGAPNLITNSTSGVASFNRTLTEWTQPRLEWNDSNTSLTLAYRIQNLTPNVWYTVWNNSAKAFKISTPSFGELTWFNVTLKGDTNIIVAQDLEPPLYSSPSVNTTTAGAPALFSVNWTDDTGLSGYIFSTNNTGAWANESFRFNSTELIFGNTSSSTSAGSYYTTSSYYYPWTLPVDGIVTKLTASCNKTSVGTSNAMMAIYDSYGILRATSGVTAISSFDWYNFTVQNVSLQAGTYYIGIQGQTGGLSCNQTVSSKPLRYINNAYGSFPELANLIAASSLEPSMYATYYPIENSSWSNFSTALNATECLGVGWKVYANDTSGNENVSSNELTTSGSCGANPFPKWFYPSTNGTCTPLTMSVYWNSSNLSTAVLATNETGIWTNYSKPVEYEEALKSIVYYHRINDTDPSAGTVKIANFTNQMIWLYDNGYHTMTFADLIGFMKNGTRPPEKTVVLTFDDGWREVYTVAYPLMKQLGFIGTANIITNTTLFNGSANGLTGRMNMSEVKELFDSGWEIGSHAKTHANLTDPSTNLSLEINETWSDIYLITGAYPKTIAYPGGENNLTVRNWAEEVGFIGGRAVQKIGVSVGQVSPREAYLWYADRNSYFNITSVPIGNATTLNNGKVDDFIYTFNNTGKDEFEDEYEVIRDDDVDIIKASYSQDSYGFVILPDKNDTIQVNVSIPKSAGYNITFRIRTGTTADNPVVLAHLLNYIIDGTAFVGNSSSAPTINTSTLYFVNDTSNFVWGFQRISNVYLTAGFHNFTVFHNANGTTGIGLDYFIVAYNDTIVNDADYYNSPRYFVGNGAWSNFTWTNSSVPAGTVIAWRVYMNDTSGNVNATDIQSFTTSGSCGATIYNQTILQGMSVSHSSPRKLSAMRTFLSSMTVSNADQRTSLMIRSFAQSVTVGNNLVTAFIAGVKEYFVSLLQGITVNSNAQQTASFFRSVSDSLSIGNAIVESFIVGVKTYLVTAIQSMSISDSSERLANIHETFTQSVTFTAVENELLVLHHFFVNVYQSISFMAKISLVRIPVTGGNTTTSACNIMRQIGHTGYYICIA